MQHNKICKTAKNQNIRIYIFEKKKMLKWQINKKLVKRDQSKAGSGLCVWDPIRWKPVVETFRQIRIFRALIRRYDI